MNLLPFPDVLQIFGSLHRLILATSQPFPQHLTVTLDLDFELLEGCLLSGSGKLLGFLFALGLLVRLDLCKVTPAIDQK